MTRAFISSHLLSLHLIASALSVFAAGALGREAGAQGSPCDLGAWEPAFDHAGGPAGDPPSCANPPVAFPSGRTESGRWVDVRQQRGRQLDAALVGIAMVRHRTSAHEQDLGDRNPERQRHVTDRLLRAVYRYGLSNLLNNQGRVTLFRLPPSAVRPYGDSCFGTLGRAPRLGVLDLGPSGVRVHASDAPPGAPSVLLVGDSDRTWQGLPLPLKLSALGFTNCELRTSVLVALPTVTGTQGGARGYGSVDVPLPIVGTGRGTLYARWLVLGQGPQAPGALSAAVSWRY